MIFIGATGAQAQPVGDPRCEGFTGRALVLCSAAAIEGCFDGVDSALCDGLVSAWDNKCSMCEGQPAPWISPSSVCPCDFTLTRLNELRPDGFADAMCFDFSSVDYPPGFAITFDPETEDDLSFDAGGFFADGCRIREFFGEGDIEVHEGISDAELAACIADLEVLADDDELGISGCEIL